MRVIGGAGHGNGNEGEDGVTSIEIHEGLPGLRGGKGVSLFDICDLLQNDLGIAVAMQELIAHLEESGVEGIKMPTEYGGILSVFDFGGWYQSWDCVLEPFMDLAGIQALEKVPEYAGLEMHRAWKDLKRRVARDKWGTGE